VLPSSINLTIDSTPTGDGLWQPFGSVSGTVGDPNATVTINGKTATVDPEDYGTGAYNWSADNVPNYGMGTATFDASAQVNAAVANVTLDPEMGPYWLIADYFCGKLDDISFLPDIPWFENELTIKSYRAQATPGSDGHWQKTFNGWEDYDSLNLYVTRVTSHDNYYQWSDTNPGSEEDSMDGQVTYDGPIQDPSVEGLPDADQVWGCASCGPGYAAGYLHHYRADGVNWVYPWVNASQTITVSAVTHVKLYTGGKASVQRQSLFRINVPYANEILMPPGGTFLPWFGTPTPPIDKTSLIVAGKHPGADGNVWTVFPDNSEQDITVTAPGKKHYDTEADPQKYKLFIQANTHILQPDRVTQFANFWVGQKINFSPVWSPEAPPFVEANSHFHWNLPGNYVNEPVVYSSQTPNCVTYDINSSLLANQTTYCWYKRDLQAATASVGMTLNFQNGQNVSIAALGQFDMHRPTLVTKDMCSDLANTITMGSPCLFVTNNSSSVTLGNSQGGYARFWAMFHARPGDHFFETQIVQSYRKWGNNSPVDSGSDWWFDGSFENKPGSSSPADVNGIGTVQQTDQYPGVPLEQPEAKVNDVFKTYFRYQPPEGDSIAITLGRVNWSWAVDAQYISGTWNIPSGTISSPDYHDDDNFPQWNGTHP